MGKMKQNKNTSVIKRVASATLAMVVFVFNFTIPAFADNSEISFIPQGQPTDFATYSGPDYTIYASSENESSIVCVCYGPNLYNLLFCSLEPETFYTKNSNSNNVVEYYCNSLQTDYNIYVYNYYVGASRGSYFSVPVYESLDDALSACKAILEESEDTGTVAEFNFSIKPGYALFIDIHGLSDVSGTLFTNTSAAYASPHTSNQTLSYQSSLPSGNVSPQGNGINWQGTGNKDLFGRYKSWNRSLIIQPNSHYIAIYNPVHISTYVDPEHEDFNGNISVHVNKAYSDTSILIPLNTELTGTGTVGTNTTEEQKPVVYDENTNSWIPQNSDGTPYSESPYGDYMPSTVNSIHDWLQNIANLISGFFNGAIGAVTTLVGAGSAFINQLVSLYSWLPAPVYAVLSSALILVITIGVIKVFI